MIQQFTCLHILRRGVTFTRVTGHAAGLSSEVRQSSDTDQSRAKQNANVRSSTVCMDSYISLMVRGAEDVMSMLLLSGKISGILRQRQF